MALELVRRFASDIGGGEIDITNPQTISGNKTLTGTNNYVPAGVIFDYAGAAPPSAWLFCDGAAVSRVTYAGLFAAIGIAYGPGDGSTTFNLPDFRGRFARYNDNMGTGAAGRDTGRVHGTSQIQTTATNGLSISVSGTNSTSGVSVSGTTGGHSADHSHAGGTTGGASNEGMNDSVGNRNIVIGTAGVGGSSYGVRARSDGSSSGFPKADDHTHTGFTTAGISANHSHGVNSSGTASAQAWSGSINVTAGAETRPINLSCNKIIKI